MAQISSYSDQRRLLLQLLYMQMLQQQAAQQVPQQPQPTTFDRIVDYARKAKGAYDDANNLYNLGSSVVNYFNPTYTQATQAAWNQAAGQAGQSLWNAGADAASGIASTPTSTTSVPGGGVSYAGLAAAGLSTYNDARKLFGDQLTDEEKALESTRAIPRAVAAYYTGGLSLLGENLARKQWGGTMKKLDKFAMKYDPFMRISKLWTSDKWKTEGKRLKSLIDKGINIPEELRAAMYQTRGRKKSELINPYLPQDFRGETPQYGWVNNKFANSRNESDLTAKDIWGYSAFFDKYGNDWLGKFSEKQREDIANRALQRGAVREHHGTIDINWTPELQSEVDAITGNRTMVPKATPQAAPPAVGVTPQPGPDTTHWKGILKRIR